MSDIFLGILNRSIAAGWLILAVILLRLLFRKAPKWISCLLWGIVAVRLVCPFSVESAFSLIPSAETDAAGADMDGTDAAQADGAEEDGTDTAQADSEEEDGAGAVRADGEDAIPEQNDADASEPADPFSAPQRYDMGDLDGNGETEYLLITSNISFGGHLSFYFNGESIYEYDDTLWMFPVGAEYIDLDRDGEKEIFFTFNPSVNSAPLMEYTVLKQTDDGWKPLEMIHGETMLDNEFPISCRYGSTDNTIVITCEGIEKEIIYNIEAHYENIVKEYRESGIDYSAFARILEENMYKEGDKFGGIAAWGIWKICSGTYDGRNCLIATHGLQGPEGKQHDMMGLVDIYFDYNEKGLVNILDMGFRDEFVY